MFKPEDLYKIFLEDQNNIENEYKKAIDEVLKKAQDILICPYHSIPFIDKQTPKGDFRMGSMASMFPDCEYCNPNDNGKTNTQQTQNTQEEPKPKQETKQSESTNPNVTPKPKAQPSQGANPIHTSFWDELDKLEEKIIQTTKDAIDFSWEQGKNVIGGALNSITGGVISSVGDKDSFAYKTTGKVVDFIPIPVNKIGKVLKIAKKPFQILAKPIKDAFIKYNTSKHPWKRKYDGAPNTMKAGGIYKNNQKKLPEFTKDGEKIIYTKYDVNHKTGDKRDAKRIVIGKDENGNIVSVHHTDSHYDDFVEITDYPKIGDKQ